MLKQLWKSVAELKTPERRLLFGLMLAAIVVLWISFRGSITEKDARISSLEKECASCQTSKDTQRILMQDKVDQCNEEKVKMLKEMYEQSEKMKQKISALP